MGKKKARTGRPKGCTRLTGEQEITAMTALSAKGAAWLLGLANPQSMRQNLTVPRNPDGSFNARDLVKYHAVDRRRRTDRPGDQERIARQSGEAGESGDDTPLDYKRKLEGQKLELEILRLQRQLVPVEETREFFAEMGTRLKAFGETLQRDYGPGALLLLNELLGGMESHVDRWLDGVSDIDSE